MAAQFLRTPKGQLLCIFGVLFAIAARFDGGFDLLPHVLMAVSAACAVDVPFGFWQTRRWIMPTSALLSGLIVAFILGPQEVSFSGRVRSICCWECWPPMAGWLCVAGCSAVRGR